MNSNCYLTRLRRNALLPASLASIAVLAVALSAWHCGPFAPNHPITAAGGLAALTLSSARLLTMILEM